VAAQQGQEELEKLLEEGRRGAGRGKDRKNAKDR
jgi:hypothetical protein